MIRLPSFVMRGAFVYSYLSDSIGFSLLARIAGMTPAMKAMPQTSSITIAIERGLNAKRLNPSKDEA